MRMNFWVERHRELNLKIKRIIQKQRVVFLKNCICGIRFLKEENHD